MAGLGTVNPNRLGVVHGNSESGEVRNTITNGFAGERNVSWDHPLLGEGHSQSRFEATGHRLARIGEGGLSSGMVFLMELEGDGVSWLGDEVVGLEGEDTRTANNNTVVCASGSVGRLRIHNDWGGRRGGEGRRGGG